MIELVKIEKKDVPVEREPDPGRMEIFGEAGYTWARPDGRVVAGRLDDAHRLAFLEIGEDRLRHATVGREARVHSLSADTTRVLLSDEAGVLIEVLLPAGEVRSLGDVGEIYFAEIADAEHVIVKHSDDRVALLRRGNGSLTEVAVAGAPLDSIVASIGRPGIVYAFPLDLEAEGMVVLDVTGGKIEELARLPNTVGKSASIKSIVCEMDGRVILCERSEGPFFEVRGLPAVVPAPTGGAPTRECIGYALPKLIELIRKGEKRATPDERLLGLIDGDMPPDIRALFKAKSEHIHMTITIGRFILRNDDPFVPALDGDEEPRSDVLVIGQTDIGDLYVVGKKARGPFAAVFKLLTEESWRQVRAWDSIDGFVRDCVSVGEEKGQRVDVKI